MNGRPPQLLFNAGTRPDCSNLATHFDPDSQPPITIRKLGNTVETIGISKTPRDAFEAVNPERLAVAVELARRKVQRDRKSYSEVALGSHDGKERENVTLKSVPQSIRGKINDEKRISKRDKKLHENEASSSGPNKLNAKETDEIASLNAELEKQLLLLNDANSRKTAGTNRSANRKDARLRHARILRWKEEEEEEEEEEDKRKLEQWKKEQQSRNARMIYDLSQQVKELEKKINRVQQCDVGIRQQEEVVKKLAAAQRAALRTLQTFGGPKARACDDIPPELTLLIQQLALLSIQLEERGGKANSEIAESVLQLVKTMEERQQVARLLKDQKLTVRSQFADNDMPNPTPVKHMKKRERVSYRQSPRTGVLLDPQLQKKRSKSQVNPKKTHYSQDTFNSLRRQQPPVEYSVVSCSSPSRHQGSVLNSSVLRPCQVALSTSPTKEVWLKKSKKGRKKPKISASSDCGKGNKAQEIDDNVLVVEEDILDESSRKDQGGAMHKETSDSKGLTIEGHNLTSVIAQQNDQLESLRYDITQKLTELRTAFATKEADVPLVRGKLMGDAESLNKSAVARSPVSGPVESGGDLSHMLRRLEELEAEENEISRRWTSVVYEDIGSRPARQRQPTRRTDKPPTVTPTAQTTSTLDTGNLCDYRERYSRYLDYTGVSTSGGFNPWKMAEKIADDLLDEIVEGVAGEVGQVCDGCMENLYNSEFLRPP